MAGTITLLIVLGLALYICWLMLQPFFNVLLWAMVLTVVFYPMHLRIRHRSKSPSLAAATSTLLVVLLIVLPVTFITIAVVRELSGAAANLQAGVQRLADPNVPFVGFMDPNWKGIAWAPTGAATLSQRRFWVVEGVPRDTYYLFGKIQLYIDALGYQGAWNRKFGWKGELLAIHQVMSWNPLPFTRPTGKVDYNQGSNQAYQTVENLKMNRATVAGRCPRFPRTARFLRRKPRARKPSRPRSTTRCAASRPATSPGKRGASR